MDENVVVDIIMGTAVDLPLDLYLFLFQIML